MMDGLTSFLLAASATLAVVAMLFFVRFWRETRDRFFLFFALAFAALGVDWGILALVSPTADTRHLYYLPRLIAFAFIILAIIEKNRKA